jgi:hypothetical protein
VSQELEIETQFSHPNSNEIMLNFRGIFSLALINALLEIMETKLDLIEPSLKVRKRVLNILIESLQNLHHHSEFGRSNTSDPIQKMSGRLLITKKQGWYSVLVGNFISNNAAEALHNKINYVNSLTSEELSKEYTQVLTNGVRSSKGGGGLGVLDMAKRSGERLEYNFVRVDNNNSFFSLNVKVKQ